MIPKLADDLRTLPADWMLREQGLIEMQTDRVPHGQT